MQRAHTDAFILFNEKETYVGNIVEDLERRGVATHFWRRDVGIGEKVDESEQLAAAGSVVVFLGEHGWGPTHLQTTQEAQQLQKRLIPVLIGTPSDSAYKAAGGLFRDHRYLDMRSLDAASHDALHQAIVTAVPQTVGDDRLDRIVRVLLEGDEDQCDEVLSEIRTSAGINRAALSSRLRAEIRQLLDRGKEPSSPLLMALILSDGQSQDTLYLLDQVDKIIGTTLGHAVRSPDDPGLLERLRNELGSIGASPTVLRFLRVMPVTGAAPEICSLLDREPRYALYALAHPAMARAAAPLLAERPGVASMVERVVAATGSRRYATRELAVILAALDLAQVERALQEARQNPETRRAAEALRECLKLSEPFVPECASDTIDTDNDHLDIREDVHTLTAVMLSRQLAPPLGIGLFGDWGSGKSYFMKSMLAASDRFTAQAKKSKGSRFCSDVRSIWFNAWNYVDTNLWASLVSHILEELAEHVSPAETPEKKQAALMVELNSAKAIAAESEAEKTHAKKQVSDREIELGELQVERQQKEIQLQDLQAGDFWTLVSSAKVSEKELKETLRSIGVPEAIRSVSDFGQMVSEAYTLKGRAAALLATLITGKDRRVVWTFLAVVLLVIPGVAYALHYWAPGIDLQARAAAVIAQVSAFFAGAATLIRKALNEMNRHISKVEKAKQKIDHAIAEKRKNPTKTEKELQSQIASLKVQEKEAESRITAAAARVRELEDRIQALQQGRSLAWFLAERTRSDDYRKHLGLISTIRKDFEALSERLQNPGDSGLRRVERIILYIDDLDRCPADKVMDVLQAVHLLLAFPLFVVVVGVDQRWLLHSLESTFPAFRSEGSSGNGDRKAWVTTPQNYLEKIFQIPFNLRPMTTGGYGRLMDQLLQPAQPVRVREESRTAGSDRIEKPGKQTERTPQGVQAEIVESGDAPKIRTQTDAARTEDKSGTSPELTIDEESLVIQDWESKFAARLFDLIPTPRAAKRFANTYRILKAPLRHHRLSEFEGTADAPGAFQVPMLLLAVSIGAPGEAANVFPMLHQCALEGESPKERLQRLAGFETLQESIRTIVAAQEFPAAPEIYLEWLPRVSRFSFEAGRAIRREKAAAASG